MIRYRDGEAGDAYRLLAWMLAPFIVCALLLLCGAVFAEDGSNNFVESPGIYTFNSPKFTVPEYHDIVLQKDGKQAVIDFGSGKVTYSGDMPVDDAARVFFDHVMTYMKENCKNDVK